MHLCRAREQAGRYDTQGDRGFMFAAFIAVTLSQHEARRSSYFPV
jgi:hypothetical protein